MPNKSRLIIESRAPCSSRARMSASSRCAQDFHFDSLGSRNSGGNSFGSASSTGLTLANETTSRFFISAVGACEWISYQAAARAISNPIAVPTARMFLIDFSVCPGMEFRLLSKIEVRDFPRADDVGQVCDCESITQCEVP